MWFLTQVIFQSTLSSRRATRSGGETGWLMYHFNPRSPHGERLFPGYGDGGYKLFQSTLSSRRATPTISPLSTPWTKFQSTLSSRRATWSKYSCTFVMSNFNPRSPHGERLAYAEAGKDAAEVFQSTLSSRRATELPGHHIH